MTVRHHAGVMTTTTRTTNRLDATAGILLIAIAILHAVFTMNAHWPAWIAGELRAGTASTDSFRAFWAQRGGFAVVVALLGLLIVRSARRGERLPGYVGWGSSAGWGCAWPSSGPRAASRRPSCRRCS